MAEIRTKRDGHDRTIDERNGVNVAAKSDDDQIAPCDNLFESDAVGTVGIDLDPRDGRFITCDSDVAVWRAQMRGNAADTNWIEAKALRIDRFGERRSKHVLLLNVKDEPRPQPARSLRKQDA